MFMTHVYLQTQSNVPVFYINTTFLVPKLHYYNES